MMITLSRMMMIHALRSFSEDPIIQRHGGKVSRFGVFWLPWHDDDARGTEARCHALASCSNPGMMTPEARKLGVLGWVGCWVGCVFGGWVVSVVV